MNTETGTAAIDLRLYLVTGPAADTAATVARVEAAVAGGATAVQLRKPGASTRELVVTARALLQALEPTGVPLLVNDRIDVALAVGAAGVHLGQSDLHPLDARRIAGAALAIGWSITDPVQMADLEGWPVGTVDYLGVGPVRPTGSKADAAPAMGYERLREVCRRSELPVVAIGGIGPGHVVPCMAAGAAGVAVVSAIWDAPDPGAAARELRAALRNR